MALRSAPSLLQQLRSVLAASTAAAEAAAAAGTRSLSSDAVHAAASATAGSRLPADGLTLKDFVSQGRSPHADLVQSPASTSGAAAADVATAASSGSQQQQQRTAFIETYGCQMNLSDSEVVLAVLAQAGFTQTVDPTAASVVLLNTCAIRENAEAKIWQRLGYWKNLKQAARRQRRPAPVVGVLGCMAERLKQRLLESDRLVDIVAGPDAYRDLPRLIDIVQGDGGSSSGSGAGGGAMNVQLSADETYADIVPVRQPDALSAYVSIMRGCNNLCSFCIVPFTRGRERSRPLQSIVEEVRTLSEQGVKEVTLLGQNVNSYADFSSSSSSSSSSADMEAREEAAAAAADPFERVYARGFRSVYKPRREGAASFAELLDAVAAVNPEMRIRFTSPHPKDFSDDVLQVVASRPNVCKQLHMPAQSGSSAALERMRRGYTREAYDDLVAHVRAVIPEVALSTDMIAGFCGETEEDHAATLDLLERVGYEQAFLYAYSLRDKTHAARHYQDDVTEDVKQRRLAELIAVYRQQLHLRSAAEVGRRHLVLVEGPSRRSAAVLTGRTDTHKRVVFEDEPVASSYHGPSAACDGPLVQLQPGDYAAVEVTSAGSTLRARALARTTLQGFVAAHGSAVPQEYFSSLSLEQNEPLQRMAG